MPKPIEPVTAIAHYGRKYHPVLPDIITGYLNKKGDNLTVELKSYPISHFQVVINSRFINGLG
ncbi:hypothetical protein [Laspinema olomoucense]|uniref:hypothetical protein n=1 Tax=Laspinema olomoucense TaxID=3231600 RepID=UPI0021BABCA6|nr:hypothetical protein [Laspinema sp. D3c]MCT7995620.1 hypothetical protein [Laspinema sp. D3c]